MTVALISETSKSLGFKARELRVYLRLTHRELASLAGVSPEEVALFERSLPVSLNVRRRVLSVLWARKCNTVNTLTKNSPLNIENFKAGVYTR